jgi:hypothetical protein
MAQMSPEQIQELQDQLATAQAEIASLTAQLPQAAVRGKLEQPKAYFSNLPFTNIHVMRGPGICEVAQFVAGKFETDDAATAAHLDKICDRPGSGITSKSQDQTNAEVEAMHADVMAAAAAAQAKMVAAGLPTA